MTGGIRAGIGFDAHVFDKSRRLVLGGVEIPNSVGLAGHSDADVIVHAICDAVLGACALGDLGTHFPDSDPKWKNSSSLALLKRCAELASKKGFVVIFIDATAILEKPKIAPYIEAMRQNIAGALGLENGESVSVKATTTEKMGFTGRGEGIAAMAIATVETIKRSKAPLSETSTIQKKSKAKTEGKESLPATIYRNAPGTSKEHSSLVPMLKEMVSILCFTDGATLGNPGPSGCAAVICEPSGVPVCAFSWPIGNATNNIAEYSALLELLEFLNGAGLAGSKIEIRMDSELVVKQLNGLYKVKSPNMAQLFAETTSVMAAFKNLKIVYVPRGENSVADLLAKEASKQKRY